MGRRATAVLVMVLLAATAVVLWAAGYGSSSNKTEKMTMKVAGPSDYGRCTKTCSTLMDNYHKSYKAMKMHEGDKQCWNTCWSRYGSSGQQATTEQMKNLWMSKRADNLRVNQCAQACWRMHHDNQKEVVVGGWRSMPRETVCH